MKNSLEELDTDQTLQKKRLMNLEQKSIQIKIQKKKKRKIKINRASVICETILQSKMHVIKVPQKRCEKEKV